MPNNSDLYVLGEHPDGVRAICKECERVVLKDTEAEAGEVVDNHNEQMHDGEDVAGICVWDVQSIDEMLPDPDEIDPDQLFNVMLALGEIDQE